MSSAPFPDRPPRITLMDVARAAGVSPATVDRVLNRRIKVKPETVERVREAVTRLGYRVDPLEPAAGRRPRVQLGFVLPQRGSAFMGELRAQVEQLGPWLEAQGARVQIFTADVFDPDSLSAVLAGPAAGMDGLAVVGGDTAPVRAAIDSLAAQGRPVVTLVSDVPTSRRLRYVGIDNTAAGRTAGTLMGRFLRGLSGPVGVVAGALALRDHIDRLNGFAQVLAREFPALRLLPVVEGQDDDARTRAVTADLLARHGDLVGLYALGGGVAGLAEAIEAAGLGAGRLPVLIHELSPLSRRLLQSGTVAAVINQDAGHEARAAARVLLQAATGQPGLQEQDRIRIDIFLKDNLP